MTKMKNKRAWGLRGVLFLVWTLILSDALWSQEAPDYWPLQVGNKWIYRHTQISIDGERSEETVALEVVSRRQVDGQDYFELSNGQLLRKDDDGNILERNRFTLNAESEFIIFDFTHLDDRQYRFFFPYAVFPPTLGYDQPSVTPVSRYTSTNNSQGIAISQTVPAGTFEAIQFGNSFGPAESTSIFLAMGVGLTLSRSGDHFLEYMLLSKVFRPIQGL